MTRQIKMFEGTDKGRIQKAVNQFLIKDHVEDPEIKVRTPESYSYAIIVEYTNMEKPVGEEEEGVEKL